MEIWGVQIPIDYVVVGGAIFISVVIVLTSRATRQTISNHFLHVNVKPGEARLLALHKALNRWSLTLRLINIVTTILALVPLIGAVIALVSEHSELALQLDVVGLIVLIVTKGGLWLLTMALIPILKGLPVGVGTGIGSYFVQRALKSRERDREPVEKK